MTTVVENWDVHPALPWLRGIRPEHEVEFDPSLNAWCVYGHPEVLAVLNDPQTFSNRTAHLAAVTIDESFTHGDVSQMDPPEQTRFRRLINRAFTARTVADLESRVTAVVHDLLDGVRGKDHIDLVTELAYPLPVIVIAELLGIPSSDRELFITQSTIVIEQMNGLAFLDGAAQSDIENAVELFMPMVEYMRGQLADRRRHPHDDLLSRLAHAELDGTRLRDDEVVNLANLLLVAGHITTTLLIGNVVTCLDAAPEQFARVRADRSLVPGALDETLRTLSPTAALSRRTTADVEVGGVHIPREQLVLCWPAAANRDPRAFDDPEVFDVARSPNPHLGFGHGIHFCIGSHLAKMEGRIAVNGLLDRYSEIRTKPHDPPRFFPSPDIIGVRSLPVHVAWS